MCDSPVLTRTPQRFFSDYRRSTLSQFVRISLPLVLFALTVSTSHAQLVDTLSYFRSDAAYSFYNLDNLVMQATRIELPAAAKLKKVRVLLNGTDSNGSARLRVFGFEAGSPAPFLERDLIKPILVEKEGPGLEWVDVDIPQEVRLSNRQFFIAIDHLSDGTVLVSDRVAREICCESKGGAWYNQVLKTENGRWSTSRYGFGVEAVVLYDHEPGNVWLKNVTASIGLADTGMVVGGIAWGDYDRDSRPDLLLNGRLYRNVSDTLFIDVSEEVGVSATPRAGLFLDIDRDSDLDLLFLGTVGQSGEGNRSFLFLSNGDGGFTRSQLDLPTNIDPSTFSVADINSDGFPDLFVGQESHPDGDDPRDLLLINNQKNQFVNAGHLLIVGLDDGSVALDGQWVDVNSDGSLDLQVTRKERSFFDIWYGSPEGTFQHVRQSILAGSEGAGNVTVNPVGGDWGTNHEGEKTFVLSQSMSLERAHGATEDVRLREYMYRGASEMSARFPGYEFSEYMGRSILVDIDNSGTEELFVPSADPCYQARLLGMSSVGIEDDLSSQVGLLNLPVGPDGVWVDFNGDGKLDLATMVDGRFCLFKNTIEGSGNWISLEIEGESLAGSSVQAYIDGEVYGKAVVSGSGHLMQNAGVPLIGIGSNSVVDSVVVAMANGPSYTVTEVALNQPTTVRRAHAQSFRADALTGVSAYPNPFDRNIEISAVLGDDSPVTIEIFDVTGKLIAVPFNGQERSGSVSVVWNGILLDGSRITAGTYTYKISTSTSEQVGRIVCTR